MTITSNERPTVVEGGADTREPKFIDGTPQSIALGQLAAAPEVRSAAILEINQIPGLPEGFFNVAAWKESDESDSRTFLLGRYVESRSAPGEPDVGTLRIAVLGGGGSVETMFEVWRPETERKGDLLEDPRVVVLPDGRVVIGCTRLMLKADGTYAPFPGFSVTTTDDLLNGKFPPTYPITGLGEGSDTTPIGSEPNVYRLLAGKNVTPFGHARFTFRPEGQDHQLIVFGLEVTGAARDVQRLDFPKSTLPDWAEFRIGSTMPPVWLNDKEAVFIFHGIQIVEGRSVYSIGSARLLRGADGTYSIDNINPQPILTPRSFDGMYAGQQVQLRPEERDALYACGGVVDNDEHATPRFIRLYANVGDTRTVEVVLSVDEITNAWVREEAIQDLMLFI